jgi:hypothetical protein
MPPIYFVQILIGALDVWNEIDTIGKRWKLNETKEETGIEDQDDDYELTMFFQIRNRVRRFLVVMV